jgi:hypothetical protein
LEFLFRKFVVCGFRAASLASTGCARERWGNFPWGLCIAARAVEAPSQRRREFEIRMLDYGIRKKDRTRRSNCSCFLERRGVGAVRKDMAFGEIFLYT